MAKRLVLSFISTDEPGQVEQITEAVAKSGGNWLRGCCPDFCARR